MKLYCLLTFDAKGEFIRQWLPELATLDNKTIHAPYSSNAKPKKDNIKTAEKLDYPEPMVELSMSRNRALDAFGELKD